MQTARGPQTPSTHALRHLSHSYTPLLTPPPSSPPLAHLFSPFLNQIGMGPPPGMGGPPPGMGRGGPPPGGPPPGMGRGDLRSPSPTPTPHHPSHTRARKFLSRQSQGCSARLKCGSCGIIGCNVRGMSWHGCLHYDHVNLTPSYCLSPLLFPSLHLFFPSRARALSSGVLPVQRHAAPVDVCYAQSSPGQQRRRLQEELHARLCYRPVALARQLGAGSGCAGGVMVAEARTRTCRRFCRGVVALAAVGQGEGWCGEEGGRVGGREGGG